MEYPIMINLNDEDMLITTEEELGRVVRDYLDIEGQVVITDSELTLEEGEQMYDM